MALPRIQTDFLPLVKYDARSGKFSRRDRVQTAGGWENQEEDIPLPFAFVADFQGLEIGWVSFKTSPPDFRLMPYPLDNQLQGIAPNTGPRPTPDHRLTFRLLIMVKLGAAPPEIRHFAHGAQSVYGEFSAVHDVFLAAEEAHNYHLAPVLKVAKTTALKTKGGTAYAPKFTLVKWVERDPAFDSHLPSQTTQEPEYTDQEPPPENGHDANEDLPF